MVASPLIDPAVLHAGLVPISTPPRTLRALWARVEFDTSQQLGASFAALAPFVDRPTIRRALVQVRYRPSTLTTEAAALHTHFAQQHSKVSTYLPLCLPGSPNAETCRPLATPEACHGCIFYQGMRCQGLGDDLQPWSGLAGHIASIRSIDQPLNSYTRADFGASNPLMYWLPQRQHLATIGAAVRAVGGRLWDLGGGNGFVSGLLAQDEGLDVTVIDRGPPLVAPAGLRWLNQDVRAPVEGPTPDAVLVSWPPTGDGFRDVIKRLKPQVVIYATDTEGFCGRRPGYCGVVAHGKHLSWAAFPVNDFAALPGLPVRVTWPVACYNDLRFKTGQRRGRLQIRAVDPLPKVESKTPYSWESLAENPTES